MQTFDLTLDHPAETWEEELADMGSHNHSLVQANLVYLFKRLDRYTVYVELSLDPNGLDRALFAVKDELIPDICLYTKRSLSLPHDILRMTEMPLLVVEILSPRQGTYTILQKFEAYFALGIQSCWMVEPTTRIVYVYSDPVNRTPFTTDSVIDPKLGIELPVAEIFQ